MSQDKSTAIGQMAFFDHIEELRSRLIKCLFVFMIGFSLCYFVSNELMAVLSRPLFEILPPESRKLYFTGLFENFFTHLKIAGYSGIFFLSPFYFYQIWAFLTPGLYPAERKLVLPFIIIATLFFIGGACFAYFVLFPVGFRFFVTYGSPSDVALLTIGNYYDTVLKLLLLFGLAFELPVIICLLGYLGLVDAPTLRKNRKIAYIGITVASALFAPPDAVSMLILMAPLLLLFEMSIFVVQWLRIKRDQKFQQNSEAVEPVNPLQGKPRDGDRQ